MKALALGAVLGLSACATAALPVSGGSQLPPQLQRVLDDYAAAWEMHDAKAIAALFATDRPVVPNACPPVTGAAAVERCYAAHCGGPLRLRAVSYAVDGALAYIIGECALDANDDAGGKFVLTLVQVDGRWLIAADMDRSYTP
jgi:ketosteroid isomerase-like protein